MTHIDIEKNGTGIEKSGTGIERSGTGIERSGTGIEKSGTGIRAGKWIRTGLMSMLLASVFVSAHAATGEALIASDGKKVEIALETADGLVTGTGRLDGGYSLIELNPPSDGTLVDGSGSGDGTQVDGSGSGTQVDGSGSGTQVDGSGSGTQVDGSGSGTYVDGSGSGNGTQVDGSGSGNGTQVDGSGSGDGTQVDGSGSGTSSESAAWGAVEIVVDCGVADMIVYEFNADGTAEEVAVHDSVNIQVWSGGRCEGR